jgi:hydroxymethylbilane synthase
MKTFIVGTRQSDLALTQTNQVITQLKAIALQHGISCDFQIKKIVTKGDRILDVTLSKVGGKGLFVKEIEQALLDKEIDMAVHSMKDMPSELPEGLLIGAVPKRVDPRDCIIAKNNNLLKDLPLGARVGTSSLRRSAQLKAFRPDLHIESIRGNIDSRIKKLDTEGYDAIVLAAAGLQRIGWEHTVSEYISPEICIPAVGQGALGIECRDDDDETKELLQLFNDTETAFTVAAERSFLSRLNGGCQVPIGAYAVMQKESTAILSMTGMVGSPDGHEILKEQMTGKDPKQLGIDLAERLIKRGADRILAEVRG